MDAQDEVINSLKSVTLELPPSCIEFCPAHPDYFVVGTYNLQKEDSVGQDRRDTAAEEENDNDDDDAPLQQSKQPQSRNGSLLLFSLEEADISHVQTVPYPAAILDLHFSPHRGKDDVMAVVSSTGTLSFFELTPPSKGGGPATLKELATHRPLGGGEGDGVLFLSCAWHPSVPGLLAITTSNYEVHVLRVDETWGVSRAMEEPVITHTLEAWTVAFSPSSTRHPDANNEDATESRSSLVVYSGGDDSKLLRTACVYNPSPTAVDDDEVLVTPYPTVTFKGHEAGVTAILPLPLQLADGSEIVVTGSYDDHLRVYRVYTSEGGFMTQRPSIVADENLGGGVWRLKLIRLEETGSEADADPGAGGKRGWTALILASCMHAGCRVVELRGDYYEGNTCDVAVLARFEEHKSMNYGSDFQPGSEHMILAAAQEEGAGGSGLRCISTSFYDRLLCLWHFSAVK